MLEQEKSRKQSIHGLAGRFLFDENVRDTNERTIYYHTRNNGAVAFSVQIAKRFDEYRRCFDSSMYFREDAIER